ncbi:MAG: hypothetical protein KBH01_01350 [Breznakibacter sp.]|nr:hypothetical protein [Breznakibacter sp.]
MPYRRLPNTDQARLRALKTAMKKSAEIRPDELLFSQRLKLDIQAFLPIFDQAVNQYVQSKDLHANYGRTLGDNFKSSRLYLSHFIQVYNMCIQRGEIGEDTRSFFGFSSTQSMPDLNTEAQLLTWGRKIISGEEQRMLAGKGNRIYNPSIAVVKVKYEQFTDIYHKHKDLLNTTEKLHEKVREFRERANGLILELWNEVEGSFGVVDSDEKRQVCIDYGIVYFYRPHEKGLLKG